MCTNKTVIYYTRILLINKHVINEEKKIWEIDHITDRMIDSISSLIVNITSETDSEISDSNY